MEHLLKSLPFASHRLSPHHLIHSSSLQSRLVLSQYRKSSSEYFIFYLALVFFFFLFFSFSFGGVLRSSKFVRNGKGVGGDERTERDGGKCAGQRKKGERGGGGAGKVNRTRYCM
jgi:hypothetical protein